jgi:phosphatidate phosphatase PAH1
MHIFVPGYELSYPQLTQCCTDLSGTLKSEALASGANDIVVVRQPDGRLLATPVNLQIGKMH